MEKRISPKMKTLGIVISIIASSIQCGNTQEEKVNSRILLGMYNPAQTEGYVELSGAKIPVKQKGMYLRKDTAAALSIMIHDFNAENPKVEIWIQSATRTFTDQKRIWNGKWNRAPFSAEKDPAKRARMILLYSSMPGTSRHHWGTDFDINELTNSYYEHGKGKIIYDWLNKNAARYGFFRPFTSGRTTGYNEERWHYSYAPESRIFIREWISRFGKPENMPKDIVFDGSKVALPWAIDYVTSISPELR